jgi:hypothetical protein
MNKVNINFDVFYTVMEHWILGHMNGTNIVTIQRRRRDTIANIL